MRKIKCKERMKEIRNMAGVLALLLTLLFAGVTIPVQAQAAESETKEISSEVTLAEEDMEENTDEDDDEETDTDEEDEEMDTDEEDGDGEKDSKEEEGIILKNTAGKNASDVAAIKELLEQQKAQGKDISKQEKNLNKIKYYKWSENGKLIGLKLYLKGKVSLKGFKNIESFSCNSYYLTKLDVSNCTKLKEMYCAENKLTQLDISKCTKLTYLNCGGNKLTRLDVSNCPKLYNLYAEKI